MTLDGQRVLNESVEARYFLLPSVSPWCRSWLPFEDQRSQEKERLLRGTLIAWHEGCGLVVGEDGVFHEIPLSALRRREAAGVR